MSVRKKYGGQVAATCVTQSKVFNLYEPVTPSIIPPVC